MQGWVVRDLENAQQEAEWQRCCGDTTACGAGCGLALLFRANSHFYGCGVPWVAHVLTSAPWPQSTKVVGDSKVVRWPSQDTRLVLV